MDKHNFNTPLPLRSVQVTDSFWKHEMELVRTQVIPYQWTALNDQVKDAAPSFCMHNFKTAAKMNAQKKALGNDFKEPTYTFRGFETLPEDPEQLEDRFYGFVFQDSDFYKWIEAVGYSLTQHPDAQLEALADGAIEYICAAQQDDGYLDTYYILNGRDKIFSNLRDNHELYCLGHLLEAAVAYYGATGKDKLLNAACRYADFVAGYFGPEDGKCKGYPGHEIAEMALIRLYETTGNEKYLNLSRYFIDQRGKAPCYFDGENHETEHDSEGFNNEYLQAHAPVREQTEAVGHAVRAVYLYSGMADAARLTQDEDLYKACETLWDNVTRQKLYITGGIGATHVGEAFSFNYDLPNDTAYAESCASIGLVFWARRMLELKPDAKYAHVMERALYNCVLSGMALDGKSFFYVNPLEVVPEACHKDARKAHVKPVRQKWFGCACCPPNIARTVSSISAYAYTQNADTLFIHLYMGSTIRKQIDGREATVSVTSGLPWNGHVQIRVASENAPLTLALRIPDWCTGYALKGAEGCSTYMKDGYLYMTKQWEHDELLELDFPMEVRILQADPRVREDIGKVAVTRGPLIYCLEAVDNGKNLHLVTLDCDAPASTEPFSINGEPVTAILMQGKRQSMPEAAGALYGPLSKPSTQDCQLRFIPYYTWGNRGENEMTVWVRAQSL